MCVLTPYQWRDAVAQCECTSVRPSVHLSVHTYVHHKMYWEQMAGSRIAGYGVLKKELNS